jgi:hypothetical protein
MTTELFPQSIQHDPAQLARDLDDKKIICGEWAVMVSFAWHEYAEAVDNGAFADARKDLLEHAKFAEEMLRQAKAQRDEIKIQILDGYPAELFIPRRENFIQKIRSYGELAEVE